MNVAPRENLLDIDGSSLAAGDDEGGHQTDGGDGAASEAADGVRF